MSVVEFDFTDEAAPLSGAEIKHLASDVKGFNDAADTMRYLLCHIGGRNMGKMKMLQDWKKINTGQEMRKRRDEAIKKLEPFVVETTLNLKLSLWQRLLLLIGRSGSVVTKLSVDNLRAVIGLESIVTVDQKITIGKESTGSRKIISK